MFRANPLMVDAGYAPASQVASVIKKAASTVHRMVETGRVEGARDGRALYVKVESLVAYYEECGNEAMAQAVREALCG